MDSLGRLAGVDYLILAVYLLSTLAAGVNGREPLAPMLGDRLRAFARSAAGPLDPLRALPVRSAARELACSTT